MLAFFDGVTTLPADFALVREAGKKGDYGLSSKQLKSLRKIRHSKENPESERVSESEQTKPALAIEMMRNAWKNGTRARYALADSWFTSKEFIEETRKIGNGCVHFVGLAKMGNTKYIVQGKEHVHQRIPLRELHILKLRFDVVDNPLHHFFHNLVRIGCILHVIGVDAGALG